MMGVVAMKIIIMTAVFFIASGLLDVSMNSQMNGLIMNRQAYLHNDIWPPVSAELVMHLAWYVMGVVFLYITLYAYSLEKKLEAVKRIQTKHRN